MDRGLGRVACLLLEDLGTGRLACVRPAGEGRGDPGGMGWDGMRRLYTVGTRI